MIVDDNCPIEAKSLPCLTLLQDLKLVWPIGKYDNIKNYDVDLDLDVVDDNDDDDDDDYVDVDVGDKDD